MKIRPQSHFAPTIHEPEYRTSVVPRFKGNPLIEALPLPIEDDKLEDFFRKPPDFEEAHRNASRMDRMFMMDDLSGFMEPTRQQLELCYALERLLRNGYPGRAPLTPERARISQKLYEMQQNGGTFAQAALDMQGQWSAALLGVSGMGKTTTLKRWSARIPQAIYHPAYGIDQVPVLIIEMPPKGSIRALALAIFDALDRAVPGNDYATNCTTGKPNEDILILRAAKLMHEHYVGMLIVDEVQNLLNSRQDIEVLMSQLVAVCNVLGVAVVLVGTNKAARLLSKDFAQGRRSIVGGISRWDRMRPEERHGDGQWEKLVEELWKYQWVRNPVELTPELRQALYDGCQGVIDLAIKFFKAAQIRAILDKSEKLTVELFAATYALEFEPLHEMLEALRLDDPKLLEKFDDIRSLDFDAHLKRCQLQIEAQTSASFSLKASDFASKVRLTTALSALGYTPEQADAAAQYVIDNQPGLNLPQAQRAAMDYLDSPKRVRAKKGGGAGGNAASVPKADPTRFDGRERDYRRAVAHALAEETPAIEMFGRLGLARPVEHFLAL